MDKIEKLFRKISKKDRLKIQETIEKLLVGKVDILDMKKISSTQFYRVRIGDYRIIFRYYQENIIIETIRIKDENTYKNL